MKVLIDATGVTRKKAGVGVYAKSLIDRLAASAEAELYLLVQDDDPDFAYPDQRNVTTLRVPSRFFRVVPLRLLFEQTWLPLLLRRHHIDVVHSLHYSFPLLRPGKAKSLVTIHDMTSFSMPEVHIALKKLYYRLFIRLSRTYADGLIFISRSARADYLRLLGEHRGVSEVIHHGKDPDFRPLEPQQQEALTAVRSHYGIPPHYLLYVGTIEPRKNLERLIEAFAIIAPRFPDTTLVLAGMMGWKQEHLPARIRELGLEARILLPGFVTEKEKALLIAGCSLFLYPSLYEGFGLPILEALASGVPTITSETSALPEVAGDASILVDPLNVAALAEATERVLSSAELQRALAEAGPVQAGKFTWERTAAETERLYRRVHGTTA